MGSLNNIKIKDYIQLKADVDISVEIPWLKLRIQYEDLKYRPSTIAKIAIQLNISHIHASRFRAYLRTLPHGDKGKICLISSKKSSDKKLLGRKLSNKELSDKQPYTRLSRHVINSKISDNDLRVYIQLSRCVGKGMTYCYPTQDYLVSKLNLKQGHISRSLQNLKGKECIGINSRGETKGKGKGNEYILYSHPEKEQKDSSSPKPTTSLAKGKEEVNPVKVEPVVEEVKENTQSNNTQSNNPEGLTKYFIDCANENNVTLVTPEKSLLSDFKSILLKEDISNIEDKIKWAFSKGSIPNKEKLRPLKLIWPNFTKAYANQLK